MRILWHSAAPWTMTGYGRCTREIAGRLHNGEHDVAVQTLSAIRKGNIWWHGEEAPYELENPMKIYESQSSFGIGEAKKHFVDYDADLYFTHFDTWMEPARKRIPNWEIPYASYVIVDHFPAPEAVIEQVQNAHTIFSMSKYAEEALDNKGIRTVSIPHGVNTNVYKPLDEEETPTHIEVENDKGEYNKVNLDDSFFIGMVAANHGDRKHIPGQMEAYKMFLDEVTEDALMYVHTAQNPPEGYNLEEIRKNIGIPKDKLLWPEGGSYHNMDDAELNAWYNAFDVFLNCSIGESWGLTITEAQAAGTPCIVTRFSSMPEQLGADPVVVDDKFGYKVFDVTPHDKVDMANHGLLVNPTLGVYRQRVSAKQYFCLPKDIFSALKFYYNNESMREEHGEKARKHVVENYDWEESVIPQWEEEFEFMESML